MMNFLYTFTNDKKYIELKSAMLEVSKKGEAGMCTLLDMVEKETAERVEKETAERVEKETAERVEKETRYKMLSEFMKNSGTSMEEAMSLFGFSKDEAGDYMNWSN